jgi:carboxypeptidase PM20D1
LKRLLLGAVAALVLLLALLVGRAARFESKQVAVEPGPTLSVDEDAVALRLAGGLRYPTVSYYDYARFDERVFRRLHTYLERTYPALHAELERETVNGLSLLYTWRGRRDDLPPVLLAAHMDVVPVEGGDAGWTHPAFAGRVADGYVWGRGTLDDKGSLFCILEAVEILVARGFQPERTILLAFGHDEEVGGYRGALAIATLLAERGVRLESALDEGGAIVVDPIPNVPWVVGLIGIAEKGSTTVELVVETEGGHSSTPPRWTAVGLLSQAVVELEENPMPGGLGGATRSMLEYAGAEAPFLFRVVLANLWLFGGALEWGFASQPPLDAMLRTTTAPTVIEGGVKENVLPRRARAAVNFRILPGNTVESVLEHVRRTVKDERVQVQLSTRPTPRNPSPVSPVDTAAFAALQGTIREIFSEAVVVPYLVLGGTDARHYVELTDAIDRFAPFVYDEDARTRIHGLDERISIQSLGDAVRFYVRLLENTAARGRAIGEREGPASQG